MRSGSSEEASSVEEQMPEGRALPMTSSQVTITYLRRVAGALALSTKGTKTNLLMIIEGKIGQEHQVQNVQIIIQERERLFLVDDQESSWKRKQHVRSQLKLIQVSLWKQIIQ